MSNEQTQNWIELHRHFSERWNNWGKTTWETIKLNTLLSSALTSLSVYAIIYFYQSLQNLTVQDNILIRLLLMIIPILLFIINEKGQINYKRQCRRMYEMTSIVIKIEAKMGLYEDRTEKEFFNKDEWYVPDYWKNLNFSKSEDFVDYQMKKEDAFYQNMKWVFSLF